MSPSRIPATQISSNSEFAKNLIVRNYPASLDLSARARDCFCVSGGNRLIVQRRGHCVTEYGIRREVFQYTLRRSNIALGNAVNQFV